MKFVFWCLVASVLVPNMVEAAPALSLRVSQGHVVVLTDDGPTPGGNSTRYDLAATFPLGNGLGLSVAGGAAVPNDGFRPIPRVSASLGLRLSGKLSVSAGPGYQYNVSYGGKDATHFVGLGISAAYQIMDGVSLSLMTGPGWTSGTGAWAAVVQPGVSINL